MKQLRVEMGLSQETLANKLFITQHALSQYETGKRKIPDDTLVLLAEQLGVTISFLKQEGVKRKEEAFYEPKTLALFSEMSSEELTEYLMNKADDDTLCEIAGNFPYDYFVQLSYDQQYEEVLNAIEQFPWDLLVEYLHPFCVEGK